MRLRFYQKGCPGFAAAWCLTLLLASPGTATEPAAVRPDGSELYRRHCASCHRPLPKTALFDRPPARIRSAIERLPVMSDLAHLSDAEIMAIARVLKTSPSEDK